MTYGEIILTIKTYNKKEKDRAKETLMTNYTLASMISSFVNRQLQGKSIPSAEELFPTAFSNGADKDNNELTKAEYDRAMMIKE